MSYSSAGKYVPPSRPVPGDIHRSGPKGAWWVELAPRRSNGIGISLEAPTWRIRVWNVAALAYLAGGLWFAHSVGVLGRVLAFMAAAAVVTLAVLYWTAVRRAPRPARPRYDEAAAERAAVVAAIAARRRELGEAA